MATPATEIFALTDEQIMGLSPQGGSPAEVLPGAASPAQNLTAETQRTAEGHVELAASERQAPAWLAEKMRDPWHGDEATALWDEKQKTEKEISSYREAFRTAADAKALKEIYPGGLTEAKAAAERARELDAIDAAFFRGDAIARAQLAQRMMQQDPAAFREMVEAGLKLLTTSNNGDRAGAPAQQPVHQAAAQSEASPEALRAYGEFEKAANAELEQTVGAAISRVLEEALPNLRLSSARGREGEPGLAPLRARLTSAVRDEVELALKSDHQLGEQVARVLSGRRFDPSARAQVVRLIDARAQELVPGAVRRVVSSWTQATLSTKSPTPSKSSSAGNSQQTGKPASTRGRRIDYGRLSDDQILSL